MSGYPEHEKLKAVQPKSQELCGFLYAVFNGRWDEFARHPKEDFPATIKRLFEQGGGFHLKTDAGDPVYLRPEEWAAAWFGIDQAKLEAEKEQMLAVQRALNERVAEVPS